ncbi:hypothetical protein STEG23_019355, partial [Scotinomys teguina]
MGFEVLFGQSRSTSCDLQDVGLSAIPSTSHLPEGHDDNGLDPWNCKPAPQLNVFLIRVDMVSLHRDRNQT